MPPEAAGPNRPAPPDTKAPLSYLHAPLSTLHSLLESGACMDWYPLYNSLRIAAISTVAVFFLGDQRTHEDPK